MMQSTSIWTAILGPLIAGLAALAGALGTQWLMRKSQKERHLQEVRLQDLSWQREDKLRFIAERQKAYLDFMAAAEALLFNSAVEHARSTENLKRSPDLRMTEALRTVIESMQKVRLVGSREATTAALRVQEKAFKLAAANADELSDATGSGFRRIYDEFVDIARRDLATDQSSHNELPAARSKRAEP